jgi:hypothetical protein
MRWGFAVAYGLLAACGGSNNPQVPPDASACSPACGDGQVCRYDACVATPAACGATLACAGDHYCDGSAMECLPWGVGPGGQSDLACHDDPAPGVFFPVEQCAWVGPPADDAFPLHAHVLATPMVATFHGTPSIVFTSYNFDDQGSDACIGGNADHFGVIRVIDGRTCEPRATIATPTVLATAAPAIGDLGGADATPEIVAARSQGGLVAFTSTPAGWAVLWETPSTLGDAFCDWSGPALHDLDDDGKPEVIFYGAVYNGQTGEALDESFGPGSDSTGVGYIPVVADVDSDGSPELLTGLQLYGWDRATRRWVAKQGVPGGFGQLAVADFGAYPAAGQDDRARLDGVAEIALMFRGVVRVFNVAGREVFRASLQSAVGPAGEGGPPVIADFDGDGRVEIGAAGATAYNVLDPDCAVRAGGAPDAESCASRSTDGVLWASEAQGLVPGSAAFDFDGDGKAEVAYGDRCFTRIYDGTTGQVLASHARTSCTFYENPVIADSDGDLHAELITTSNPSCGGACPAIDPMFDGVACVDDGDCAGATRCGVERGATLGRCRCARDADCGDGYACRDPSAGPSLAGKVCRASHPMASLTGVRVLADAADRWVAARPIWNQHAYSVTHVDPSGAVPRTSQWLRNWAQAGLNSFRQNVPADLATAHARPDLTVKQARVACDASEPTVVAEVCNRGATAVAAGLPVAVYAATTPSKLRCATATTEALLPGACTTASCAWLGAPGDGAVVIDDRGNGSSTARECREDNNTIAISVRCP